jgi:hypothetical protein
MILGFFLLLINICCPRFENLYFEIVSANLIKSGEFRASNFRFIRLGG